MSDGGGSGVDLLAMVIKGGWVMYPIVILSVASITLFIERSIVLLVQNFKLKPEKFIKMFEEAFERNNKDKKKTVEELIPIVQKRGGVCAEIVSAAMEKYLDGTAKNLSPVDLKQWMNHAAESRATVEIATLENRLGWLAVFSNVATLMGLFGTVYGMIESFAAMANSPGGVKADEMAGGIAIALVATLFGLVVAIPSLMLYNLLKGIIEGYVLKIEDATNVAIDYLLS